MCSSAGNEPRRFAANVDCHRAKKGDRASAVICILSAEGSSSAPGITPCALSTLGGAQAFLREHIALRGCPQQQACSDTAIRLTCEAQDKYMYSMEALPCLQIAIGILLCFKVVSCLSATST
ncbi:hypothetical protein JG688_00009943 [Phytophthora aleatoria]|uniref:Uncharacterized protein n=1 Tax=Phytophthora aleatoria TaxID=2496075 RepID=A0A8J5IQW5_9STRA|nr:hypothetical protein JG688_00009943 [Phytophthora aleatoria]